MSIAVTVGPAGADFEGSDSLVIQAAIEYVAARGGGTVKLLPGTFGLFNSIRLRSGVELVGFGPHTVLLKEPSVTVPLVEDTDWYEHRVTVAETSGFRVGGGVMLQGKCPHTGALQVTLSTVVGIEGNTLYLQDAGRGADVPAHVGNFWVGHEATVSTCFSLVTANWAHDMRVADLRIDGNREHSGAPNGNYGAALYFQDCERVHLQRLTVGNIDSDCLSFQVVHDLTVEDSLFHDSQQGIHTGSGSQRPIMRNNLVRGISRHAISWCWGVRHGLLAGNTIEDSVTGISIGHRDTDNVMRGNVVRRCDEGLVYRDDPPHQAAHNNLVEGNTFAEIRSGYAVEMLAPVEGNIIRGNRFVNMKAGVRIGEAVKSVVVEGNVLENVAAEVEDLRRG